MHSVSKPSHHSLVLVTWLVSAVTPVAMVDDPADPAFRTPNAGTTIDEIREKIIFNKIATAT